jgi:hypothetical protein
MNIGKAVLIYCVVAIALMVWARGSIVAWVDLFFMGLSVVILYYGLKEWRESRKLSFTLIIGSLGVVITVSLFFFAPGWLFPRID